MERATVTSGAIRSVGYDDVSQTLEIEFRTGRVYQYANVPPETHAWLLRVDNKGGFVNRMILPHFSASEVVGPNAPPLDLEAALRTSVASTKKPGDPEPES